MSKGSKRAAKQEEDQVEYPRFRLKIYLLQGSLYILASQSILSEIQVSNRSNYESM
jgi:hypothetical protein